MPKENRLERPAWLEARQSSQPLDVESNYEAAKVPSVLFVCTGNICRSAYAHWRLRTLWEARGLGPVVVSSAGIEGVVGAAADPTMAEVARARGVDMSEHRARQLTGRLLAQADVVLTFAPEHGAWIARNEPEALERVKPLRGLAAMAGWKAETRRWRRMTLPEQWAATPVQDGAGPADSVSTTGRHAAQDEGSNWIRDPYLRERVVYEEAATQIDAALEALISRGLQRTPSC